MQQTRYKKAHPTQYDYNVGHFEVGFIYYIDKNFNSKTPTVRVRNLQGLLLWVVNGSIVNGQRWH